MLETLLVQSSFSVVLKIRKLSFWHRIDFRSQSGQAELFSSVQPMLLALYSLIIGSMVSQQKSSIQFRIIDYRNL